MNTIVSVFFQDTSEAKNRSLKVFDSGVNSPTELRLFLGHGSSTTPNEFLTPRRLTPDMFLYYTSSASMSGRVTTTTTANLYFIDTTPQKLISLPPQYYHMVFRGSRTRLVGPGSQNQQCHWQPRPISVPDTLSLQGRIIRSCLTDEETKRRLPSSGRQVKQLEQAGT